MTNAPCPTGPLPADATLVAELVERLGRLVRADRRAGPLNELQWLTLRFLARANRYSRNPGALARWLGVSKGAASQTVDALSKLGLILRLPDPRDGRAVALELTAGGRRMAAGDPLLQLEAALASQPGLAATAATLTAALTELQRAGGNHAFGICRTCRHFRPDDARGETGGPHRCGLTREPLNDDETAQVCGEFEAPAAA